MSSISLDTLIHRNDHTKIDLDQARLLPTDDLQRVVDYTNRRAYV